MTENRIITLNAPNWIVKWAFPILLGVATYGATNFLGNLVEQATQNQRLDSLERNLQNVNGELKVDTEFRIHSIDFEATVKEYQVQQNEAIKSLLEGQHRITSLLGTYRPTDK